MVAKFVQPNFTTQDAATYKASIDAAVAVHHRLAGPFAAHQQDAGSPAPDLTVRVDAGSIWDGTTLAEVAAQTVSGFTIPSAGQHRIDRVVADPVTGAASRVAGTAVTGSPSASAPSIPTGKVPICRVLITSANTVITDDMITDERVFFTSVPSLRKNAIINGAFDVWQRGTSFAAIANDAYSADCWQYSKGGGTTAVHTISRSTDVPTLAQAGRLFNYSLLMDCTTADGSIAAGEFCVLQYPLEGYNWAPLAQREIVLSFWVKATKTGIYCCSLQNTGNDRAYVAEYTVNAADTWERKTVAIPASPSAGTWDYTNGRGVKVRFALAVGSTFHTTAGAWATGHFMATANQVNACDDAANNFRLAGVKLELGTTATDYDYRTFQEELALCQRYYAKTFPYDTAPAQNTGIIASPLFDVARVNNQAIAASWEFPVEMRTTPTITTYSPNAASANWETNATTPTAAVRANDSNKSVQIAGSTSSTAGNGYSIHVQADASL